MKIFLGIVLLVTLQPAVSGNFGFVEISPASPNAGDNISVRLHAFCPYNSIDENPQGLDHSFVLEDPNSITFTYIINTQVGCILQPPTPPFIAEFELGVLEEGTYTLDTFFASNQESLPTQNGQLFSNISFQVGAGSSPESVDMLSGVTKWLLVTLMLMIGLLITGAPTKYLKD